MKGKVNDMMSNQRIATITKGIYDACVISRQQTLELCNIYMNEQDKPIEERRKEVDKSLDNHRRVIDSACCMLSVLHITCVEKFTENTWNKLSRMQNDIWKLAISTLDIEYYYN